MTNAVTIKEEKENIAGYIFANIKRPSVYAAWDPENMKYGVYRGRKSPMSADALDARYVNNDILPTDMFLLRALHCFEFAPAECVAHLVKYWQEEDRYLAIKDRRSSLLFPKLPMYRDYFHRLDKLSMYGAAVRYDFYPEYPKLNRTGLDDACRETIFRGNAYGIQMYKRLLQDRSIPYDPREAYANAHDAFASCLTAIAVAPFLKSSKLKSVAFRKMETIEKKKCRYRASMTFNLAGRDGDPSEDTEVIFEGICFRTDERMVTLDKRYEYCTEKVKELFAVFMEHQKDHQVYIVFCCEDVMGVKQIGDILMEYAPFMLDKCLFTTGNIIHTSNALNIPEALRRCFMCFEKRDDGGFSFEGATGFYFIEIDEKK